MKYWSSYWQFQLHCVLSWILRSGHSSTWPLHSHWGLTLRCSSRHQSLVQLSLSSLILNSIWPSSLLWKTSWLCGLWDLYIHLKETGSPFFFISFSWLNINERACPSATYSYQSWPKRSKKTEWEGSCEAWWKRSGKLHVWWMAI